MIYCKYTYENVHKIRVLDLLQNKSWEIEGACLGTFTNVTATGLEPRTT